MKKAKIIVIASSFSESAQIQNELLKISIASGLSIEYLREAFEKTANLSSYKTSIDYASLQLASLQIGKEISFDIPKPILYEKPQSKFFSKPKNNFKKR